jgi:TolB-like protein/Tfp pilus assembly protein PilF
LRQGAVVIPLQPQVFDFLEFLLRNHDRVVSRDDILAAIWRGRIVSESTLASRINAARSAIGDSGEDQRLIRTIPRKGVRFVGAVREEPQATTERPRDNPSIAVLPFHNLSNDPQQEYFADGIVDEITTGLARIKWLLVIARGSSFTYKGKTINVTQVGRELGVRYVLEGSVRKAGNRVRITAQLVETAAGTHIWAECYDHLLDDIFEAQDELTASVVGAIEPNLRKAEIERIKRKRPDSFDAYDLVLQALPFVYSTMAEGAATAIPLIQKALDLEPNYATAHAALAWCHCFRFSRGLREADRAAAIEHAKAAIAGGTDDATALAIAGLVIWFEEHDSSTALDLFDRALAISNSNIYALCCSAVALAWMGHAEAALERGQRAIRLSPFDPLNYMSYGALAIAYFHTGCYEQAREKARRAIEFNPRFSMPHALLTAALVRLKRSEEAALAAQHVLKLHPTFTIRGLLLTIGLELAVFAPFAQAWIEAGLPET